MYVRTYPREGTLIGRLQHPVKYQCKPQPRGNRDCAHMSSVKVFSRLRYFFAKRRRKPAATPTNPDPRSSMLAGSGTSWVCGGVASVPNWITTLLNVELTVTPGTTRVKVNVPTKNGLCGSLPAILPLAFA